MVTVKQCRTDQNVVLTVYVHAHYFDYRTVFLIYSVNFYKMLFFVEYVCHA